MDRAKQVVREYSYRPRRLPTVVLFCLALGGAILLGYFALYADSGVATARGIKLTRDQFRVVTGIVAILSPIGLFFLGRAVIESFTSDRRLVITTDSMILPKASWAGTSRTVIEIPFAKIEFAQIIPFMGSTKLLQIGHAGRTIHVPGNLFASRAEFDEVCALVNTSIAER